MYEFSVVIRAGEFKPFLDLRLIGPDSRHHGVDFKVIAS